MKILGDQSQLATVNSGIPADHRRHARRRQASTALVGNRLLA
jgi:hypothetical protein